MPRPSGAKAPTSELIIFIGANAPTSKLIIFIEAKAPTSKLIIFIGAKAPTSESNMATKTPAGDVPYNEEGNTFLFPICNECKHQQGGAKCAAFEVIPDEILDGEIGHDVPYPGQKNDIVFEKETTD